MIAWAIVAALAVLSHVAPFPLLLDAAGPGRVMWRAPATADPTVYLTFDDGPNPAATPALLDELARQRVRATFFLIDRHVTPETAPIVRRMFAEGHGVALHTHTRRLIWRSPSGLVHWLDEASRHVETLAGRAPCRAFRPHAGWRSPQMLAGLARADYQLVGWGWNLWDWNWFRRKTGESIASRLARYASDGSIVVMHDGHHVNPRADRSYAVDAVTRLIPALRARGFGFRTICDAIAQPSSPP